jgi:RimJ/RimL family protein N-acetyltransferase
VNLAAETLENRWVRLEPLVDGLRQEVAEALDCDPEAWDMMATAAHGPHFGRWWQAAQDGMAAGDRIAWAVRDLRIGRVFGTTSLLNIVRPDRRCELGSTFYRPEARGGAINPACKLLVLGHAFASGANRVELVTDALNVRSRAAILKLGATAEGVLRRHKVTWTGRTRDTAVFSVLAEEWPAVSATLQDRLARFGHQPSG